MIPHDVLISAKVAMLEVVMRDLLVEHFCQQPDPMAAVTVYVQKYEASHKPASPMEDAVDVVWQEFLDAMVAGVQARLSG